MPGRRSGAEHKHVGLAGAGAVMLRQLCPAVWVCVHGLLLGVEQAALHLYSMSQMDCQGVSEVGRES